YGNSPAVRLAITKLTASRPNVVSNFTYLLPSQVIIQQSPHRDAITQELHRRDYRAPDDHRGADERNRFEYTAEAQHEGGCFANLRRSSQQNTKLATVPGGFDTKNTEATAYRADFSPLNLPHLKYHNHHTDHPRTARRIQFLGECQTEGFKYHRTQLIQEAYDLELDFTEGGKHDAKDDDGEIENLGTGRRFEPKSGEGE
ncbi:MAG: hypothetical protein Q9200_007448, partial [Gallowayella weberi]